MSIFEDHHINDGAKGYDHAISVLMKAKQHVEGGKQGSELTTKYDGSPSVVFGHHPETGKFFVASKSAFNKNPKINYTEADIQQNHGHAPGLVQKLKAALKHLHKVTPSEGVFQGDLMHTPEDVKQTGDGVQFKPNTITYSAKGSEAETIKRSKIGIVVHTQYKGKNFESMAAAPIKDHSKFGQHSDVHMIQPTYGGSGKKLGRYLEGKLNQHLLNAKEGHRDTNYNAIAPMKEHIKTYINSTIRDGSEPSYQGLVSHIQKKHQKNIDSVKTEKAKQTKQASMNADLEHLDRHAGSFASALQTYHHLQKAKDILVGHMNKDYQGFEHFIGDKKSNPEGFVVAHKGQLTKLVDRREFSAANFAPKG